MLIRVALVVVGSAVAAGAATTGPTTAPAGGGFYAAPAEEGVYVPDSAAGLDKLALADRMAGRGQWDSAGSLMQEVLEKYADKVAPQRLNGQGKVVEYAGLSAAVHERIARWPAAGRAAYAARYEPAAKRLLEEAGRDAERLQIIARRYLETPSGRVAGMRLMDLRMERGEFSAAEWMGERLLKGGATDPVTRGEILYRLGWAAHLGERDELAHRWLAELKKDAPGAQGTVRGKKVDLAASLEEAMGQPVARGEESGKGWETVGGRDDRAGVGPAIPSSGQKLYSVALARGASSAGDGMEPPPAEMRMGVIPAVDGEEELFFQDGRHLYAVDLNSGLPLSGWAQTYGAQGGRFELPSGRPVLAGGPSAVTVGAEDVYAVMGGGMNRPEVFGQRDRAGSLTRLVCLDRLSGRVEWIVSPEDLEAGAAVMSLEFSGAPIAAGENVYVLGRGDTGTFESCYAICLDARTGEKKWVRYVAGSATGGAGFGGMESPLSPATSHPALSQGRLFIAGENGAVAALDAGTGAVRWLSLYPRRTAERGSREGAVEGQLLRPWSANPVIVKNGTVFILPSDGEDLLVYDAGDGRELKRIPRSAFGEADTLVGVWGEWVIVTGRRRAWGVKWAAYDAQAKDVSRVIVRSADLSEVRGRGLVIRASRYGAAHSDW
jgi:outer membrane protein assembly factor BamB